MLATFAALAALNLGAPLHGDFDADGKADVARVVKAASGDLRIQVWRGADPSRPILIGTYPAEADIFIDQAIAGRWPTACAKGHGLDIDPCPRKVVVTRGGELTFGVREASESVVVWDGRRFESVLVSD